MLRKLLNWIRYEIYTETVQLPWVGGNHHLWAEQLLLTTETDHGRAGFATGSLKIFPNNWISNQINNLRVIAAQDIQFYRSVNEFFKTVIRQSYLKLS
jgi:hypothetical protein